jgi:hypothetical protein
LVYIIITFNSILRKSGTLLEDDVVKLLRQELQDYLKPLISHSAADIQVGKVIPAASS